MAPTPSRSRSLTAVVLALALGAASCGDDPAVLETLYLRVTADALPAGARLTELRFHFARGAERYPGPGQLADFTRPLGGEDPALAPVFGTVKYDGTAFGGPDVTLLVSGRDGAGATLARFEGPVDLSARKVVLVHLAAVDAACDADGDGFLDCAVAGCCAAATAFADCAPADASANPWGVEPACEPCADDVDQDCAGGDQPCVDADADGVADCAEVTCGAGDPTVGAGLPEVCDGKDNDCDGTTDIGPGLVLVVGGQSLVKGDTCGVGVCEGGAVVCDAAGGLRCSTEPLQAAVEDCANALDDDCDGAVNEGCGGDLDGDGFTTGDGDCDDYDAGRFPANPAEPCCPRLAEGDPAAEARCDANCDGTVSFCEVGDVDGDGVTATAGDCNDADAGVYPGASERCGDGVDQDCFAGDLACAGVVDGDNDGWPAEVDCDDGADSIHPGADEACDGVDNDCDALVDEGNPDTLPSCGTDVGECALGREVCVNGGGLRGVVDCLEDVEPADEACNGKDDDCDGDSDEDFRYADAPIGASCVGRGACGAGTVQCSLVSAGATCSTNPDGATPEDATEVCDALDNDCDGELNEGVDDPAASDCDREGVCGAGLAQIVATCQPDGTWQCDYAAVPGYEGSTEQSCDGLDNDCDGVPDDEFKVGTGCDGADADACANGTLRCVAGDTTRTFCDESAASTAVETCDGLDNDCDSLTDEDFKSGPDNVVTLSGAAYVGDNGKALGAPCGTGFCGAGTVACKDATSLVCSTPNTASTDLCDGVDNDCDGQTDEEYLPGGPVKYTGGPWTGGTDTGRGKGEACGTGACAGGVVACATNKTSLTCSTLVGGVTLETCDAADNDCDGATDETFMPGGSVSFGGGPNPADAGKGLGQTCGTGACAGGSVVCSADHSGLTCDRLALVATDVCDGVDNDCNAVTDDAYGLTGAVKLAGALYAADNGKAKGQPCGVGPCAGGAVVCATTTSLACSSNASAQAEVCDAADQDCDGVADDGLTYVGAVFSGDEGKAKGATCGTGACEGGTVVCGAVPTQLTCSTLATLAAPEACDGQDDDCDGATDEDFKTAAYTYTDPQYILDSGLAWGASCGTGACAGGHVGCNAAGNGLACDTVLEHRTAEVCDAVDNDCDGIQNEGFPNQDGDSLADCVDPDLDGDAIADNAHGLGLGVVCASGTTTACDDNCPYAANPDQLDLDGDGLGNACDPDVDGDGIAEAGAPAACNDATANCNDNCPAVANATQADLDNDGLGDACDPDQDGDGVLDQNPLGGACTGGNVLNCDDNCPRLANPTQADLDLDGKGDLCDDCNDRDGDGWGRGGYSTALCPKPSGDCDDSANNVNDVDGDNICANVDGVGLPGASPCTGGATTGCDDNCPNAANATQIDADGDSVGDACDPCTDVDEDGWGRAGLARTGCPGLPLGAEDCADDPAVDALEDVDGDNLCATLPAGASVCADGVATACLDNCPEDADPEQVDADGDGIGDECDLCARGQEPYEVCRDCLDNDCDGLVDEAGCVERRAIAVQVGTALPANYPLSLTFDHAFMVTRGLSTASGDDVRVYAYDAARYRYEQIDLVLDPTSSWNSAYTRLWFATQAPLAASQTDTEGYVLVLGATDPMTHRDPAAVFHYADLFDRTAAAVGNGWTEAETAGATAVSAAGALWFEDPGDAVYEPWVATSFTPITEGRWSWRFGFDWTRAAGEGTYRVLMQLGDSATMVAPGTNASVFPNTGVGVSLVWGGSAVGLVGEEKLGFEAAGVAATAGDLSGATDLEVTFDLDTLTPSYSVAADGVPYGADGAFSQAVARIDRMRFISDRVALGGAAGRTFDYVLVRPVVDDEPLAYIGAKEATACTLTSTSLVARYYADDPADGVTGNLRDDASPASNLSRTADATSWPAFFTVGGNYAACWGSDATTGRFLSSSSAELSAALGTTKAATLELVLEQYPMSNFATARPGGVYFFNVEDSSNVSRFTLRTTDNAQIEFRYNAEALGGRWPLVFPAAQRTVLHLVWDTANDTAADRVRLYRDGHRLSMAGTVTAPTKNLNSNLGTTPAFLLGNRRAANGTSRPYAAPYGCIYYTAVYSAALDAATIASHAARLSRDDDRNPLP